MGIKSIVTTDRIVVIARKAKIRPMFRDCKTCNGPICSNHMLAVDEIRNLANLVRKPLSLPETGDRCAIDKNMVDFAIQRHRVGPMLYRAIQQDSDLETDAALFDELHETFIANNRLILMQKAVTKKVQKLFNAKGIICLSIKGFDLAEQIYEDPNVRHSKDIDLLVRPSDRDAALSVLYDAGYLNAQDNNGKRMLRARLWFKTFKDVVFVDPRFGQVIELHRQLLNYEPVGFTPEFMDSCSPGEPVPMSNVRYLLYLILHGAHANWFRLKWLADLSILSRRSSAETLNEVLALARHYGCHEAVVASLFFAEDIFPGSLRDDAREMVDHHAVDDGVMESQKSYLHALSNMAIESNQQRFFRQRFTERSTQIFKNRISPAEVIPNRIFRAILSRF